MREFDGNDEQRANDAIRSAFPLDAGMSAEAARRIHVQLRPRVDSPVRPRRAWIALASVVTTVVLAVGAVALYSSMSRRSPEPVAATEYESEPAGSDVGVPEAEAKVVPALALRAISEPADVLHFTSTADTRIGPRAGQSEEEMWLDPKTGAGRLVRMDFKGGKLVLTTTIVSDGSTATITTQQAGRPAETEAADPAGRWRNSFDKLAAYRNMLESEFATVTARGTKDGVETYRIQAKVPGFGGTGMDVVMEAEIRATDYFPISYSSAFEDPESGRLIPIRTNVFSTFEHVKAEDVPPGLLAPAAEPVRGTIRSTQESFVL